MKDNVLILHQNVVEELQKKLKELEEKGIFGNISLPWETTYAMDSKTVFSPVIKHNIAPRSAYAILEIFGILCDQGFDVETMLEFIVNEVVLKIEHTSDFHRLIKTWTHRQTCLNQIEQNEISKAKARTYGICANELKKVIE